MKYTYRIVCVIWLLCVVAFVCLCGWADEQFRNMRNTSTIVVQPKIEKIHEHITKFPEDVIEETEDYIVDEVEKEMTVMSHSNPQPTIVVLPTPSPTQPPKKQKSLPTATITESLGRVQGPQEVETYYNLPMDRVVQTMRDRGYAEADYPYYVTDSGVKMLGDFIIVAADLSVYPRGTVVQTSLGQGIVCDTGEALNGVIDIAVEW